MANSKQEIFVFYNDEYTGKYYVKFYLELLEPGPYKFDLISKQIATTRRLVGPSKKVITLNGPWEFKGILNDASYRCETNRPAITHFQGKDYLFIIMAPYLMVEVTAGLFVCLFVWTNCTTTQTKRSGW